MNAAAHAGLGEMKLEYDANENPEIFQQLCQLDLQQVIEQVTMRHQLHTLSASSPDTAASSPHPSLFVSLCSAAGQQFRNPRHSKSDRPMPMKAERIACDCRAKQLCSSRQTRLLQP